MFRIFIVLFLLFNFNSFCFGIEWIELISQNNKVLYLDKDSVSKIDGYYFYNIKCINSYTNSYTVLTIQSSLSHPYSARIKAYEVDEYENLNGDYHNISLNKTKKLEMITYDSIAYAAYKKVKSLMESKTLQITIE